MTDDERKERDLVEELVAVRVRELYPNCASFKVATLLAADGAERHGKSGIRYRDSHGHHRMSAERGVVYVGAAERLRELAASENREVNWAFRPRSERRS